jgi:hypothetical protein
VDLAFCCLGLLLSPERLDLVIGSMPEYRQEHLRALRTGMSDRPRSELVERLRALRQREAREGVEKSGTADRWKWEALPPPLRRWVWERQQGSNGREDHQGAA